MHSQSNNSQHVHVDYDLLTMAPRKDHAKSKKCDLPYVINSLNILLYDMF